LTAKAPLHIFLDAEFTDKTEKLKKISAKIRKPASNILNLPVFACSLLRTRSRRRDDL
jgi:hypothetical protein